MLNTRINRSSCPASTLRCIGINPPSSVVSPDVHKNNCKRDYANLIVHWGQAETADMQEPQEIKWDDGTPATLDDYIRLSSSTQCSHGTERGMVTIFYSNVVAVASYDASKGHWVIQEQGSRGGPAQLLQTNPAATDEELQYEIANHRVAYRTTINRSHMQDVSAVEA